MRRITALGVPAKLVGTLSLAAVSTLLACGGDDGEDTKKKTVYVTMSLANSDVSADDTVEIKNVNKCSRDAESNFGTLKFKGGKNGPKLIVKIRDLQAKEYTCTQAGETKSYFDGCFVYAEFPSTDQEDTVNGYSMAASDYTHDNVSDFPYNGSCTVDVTQVDPKIEGSITCKKMRQTKFNGGERFPVDENTPVADLTVDSFQCKP